MSWQVGLCCLVCGCRLLEKWKKVQVCRMLNLIHQQIVCKESVKSSSLHEINVNSGIKKKTQREVQKVKRVSRSSPVEGVHRWKYSTSRLSGKC